MNKEEEHAGGQENINENEQDDINKNEPDENTVTYVTDISISTEVSDLI